MIRRGSVAALLLFTLSACESPLRPRASVSNEWGTVYASDVQTARSCSRLLAEVAPLVARSLPALGPRAMEVQILPRIGWSGAPPIWEQTAGAHVETSTSDWIQIREESGSKPGVLAHELVHAWLGKEWKALPAVVEEALCEVVAEAADPGERPVRRLASVLYFETAFKGGFRFDARGNPIEPRRLSVAGSPPAFIVDTFHGTAKMRIDRRRIPGVVETLELDDKKLLTYRDLGQQNLMRAVGYVIVSRVRIDRLLELCLRARDDGLAMIPADWLLEAAHIESRKLADWEPLFHAWYGDAERAELMRQVGPFPKVSTETAEISP